MSLLSVNNVGKNFRAYSSEWKRFARWFGIQTKSQEEHWVLKHVSFEIDSGEAIGIIGQNGAGKSTLLKMITGTLKPSEGSIQVNGRISAILELGMGFNTELTGRQNVFHSAGMMGFSNEQVTNVIEEIEAFAEIGEYFDEPVRVYSSGMQVRVAFAVATAFRPEILIVDEALSVGDAYFQHKSFARIKDFQEQGTTLLIVSHDRSAIQALCNRAIMLEQGTVIKDGNPEEVFDFYNAIIAEKENATVTVEKTADGRAKTVSGTGEASLESINFQNSDGKIIEHIKLGEKVKLISSVNINSSLEDLVFGVSIRDRLGQEMFATNTWFTEQVLINPELGRIYVFSMEFEMIFGVGSYSITTALHSGRTHVENNYEWKDLALMFNVVNVDKTQFHGAVWLQPDIRIKLVE